MNDDLIRRVRNESIISNSALSKEVLTYIERTNYLEDAFQEVLRECNIEKVKVKSLIQYILDLHDQNHGQKGISLGYGCEVCNLIQGDLYGLKEKEQS